MSSLPSGFEPIEASGAEPAWQISAQFFIGAMHQGTLREFR